MKVLIIEDEQLAVAKLTQTLNKAEPDAEVIGVAESIASSVKWLLEHEAPDLILMDIELADGQSFAIFEQVEVTSPVIFTTSYDEYALRAFKVNSIDYLLKPIQQNELKAALQKLQALRSNSIKTDEQTLKIEKLVNQLQQQAGLKEYRKRFLVRHLQKLLSIEMEHIAYFYSEDRVSFFRTFDGQRYLVDYTMDEIEEMIDPKYFFRPGRALIVAIGSVEQMEPYFGNRLALRLKPGFDKEALVSREKVSDFKVWMGK
ncbi:response regulator transcription factor [Mucilaginibacter limnophilus]|uniref:Response regulator transcription factor n=1 Tax=Mucilaginibacter limnophilus TaxID=1932778 RepID=A0A437MZV8_9SPHI|nr:LytTR family DNA-binding domain-containing protein [Mucilaginibacter limnophilus]RVU03146.1 response regulator transcription factor [Mucilaginibacter limnophilus]